MLYASFLISTFVEQLQSYAIASLVALVVVTLVLVGTSFRHRRHAEYVAALALMHAPYTTRETLFHCRSSLIEAGESPPGEGRMVDSLLLAEGAVREALPAIVRRYRADHVLTWAVLHEIDTEVRFLLTSSGKHNPRIVNLICGSAQSNYPKSNRPVSIQDLGLVTMSLQATIRAWYQAENAEDGPPPLNRGTLSKAAHIALLET
jgi:hypothetical protein